MTFWTDLRVTFSRHFPILTGKKKVKHEEQVKLFSFLRGKEKHPAVGHRVVMLTWTRPWLTRLTRCTKNLVKPESSCKMQSQFCRLIQWFCSWDSGHEETCWLSDGLHESRRSRRWPSPIAFALSLYLSRLPSYTDVSLPEFHAPKIRDHVCMYIYFPYRTPKYLLVYMIITIGLYCRHGGGGEMSQKEKDAATTARPLLPY